MNKFTKIINRTLEQLNEINADGTATPSPYSGGIQSTTQKTSNTSPTGGISNVNDPLHSAFEKIKQNPDNPSLSDDEHKAIQGLAQNLSKSVPAANTDEEENKTEEPTKPVAPEGNAYSANPTGGQVQSTIKGA